MSNITLYRPEFLREDYLNRIFARLAAAFGSQFTAKWEGTNLDEVKAVWGETLQRYSDQPMAIKGALEEATLLPFPPNLGEFYALCQKRYINFNALPKVEAPPVNHEKAKAFADELAKVLASSAKGADPIFWATHPKSHLAFDYIRGAAKNDPKRFQPCIDHLIATGRVSPDGKRLLVKYAGLGEWTKA